MVRSHHTWYLFLLLLRDVNERGAGGCGTVMWVCASLGAKLTWVPFHIFAAAVRCGFPVFGFLSLLVSV